MKNPLDTLRAAGQEPVALGERALVLPFGGRVLGLHPAPGINALWTHPALEEAETAAALLADPGWANSGGVRAWISPEMETHVADPSRFWETYAVPRQVDPGDYRVSASDDRSVTLESNMAPVFYRHGVEVPLHLRRSISLLDLDESAVPEGVRGVGIAIDSTLSAAGPLPAGVRPGLWNLVQVPGDGEVTIPVRSGADPVAMVGEPVYTMEGGVIRCRVKTDNSFKFSLRAGDCRGFMACLNEDGPAPVLLAFRFTVHDASLYSDVPRADPTDTGQVQQVYVDDGRFGGFGELEYHTPALASGVRERVKDHAELRAFTGPAKALKDLLDEIIPSP